MVSVSNIIFVCPLLGNVERRQAGLQVGTCEGFKNFHGELDDVSSYVECNKCHAMDIRYLNNNYFTYFTMY